LAVGLWVVRAGRDASSAASLGNPAKTDRTECHHRIV